MNDGKKYYCSFCGKRQDEVCKLIAGPTVFICDECTDLCADIVRKNRSCPGEVEYASWAEVPASVKVVPAQPDPITELRAELAESTRKIIQAVRAYGR
jgi:hypothetical protein